MVDFAGMLSWIEALVLGVVQGLTEFLPISSSGHLAISQNLFGLEEAPLLYDVLLHFATLLAVVWVFRSTIGQLLKAVPRLPSFLMRLFQKGHLAIGDDPQAWLVILIFVSNVATVALGFFLRDQIKEAFTSLYAVAGALAVTGTLLFFTRGRVPWKEERRGRPEGKSSVATTLKDAFALGLAQGLAIFPGLSRSGTTISVALWLGLNRRFAGEYAFLVSLPAILGALIFESRHGLGALNASIGSAAIGFLASFVLGVVTLRWMLGWIRSGKLTGFAFYCWGLALLTGIWALVS